MVPSPFINPAKYPPKNLFLSDGSIVANLNKFFDNSMYKKK